MSKLRPAAARRARLATSLRRPDNKDAAASRRNRALTGYDYRIYAREAGMNSRSMAGWIGFAGILMVILGGLSVFEGLIALLEDNYYVATQSGFLVVDVTAWGWIMLI